MFGNSPCGLILNPDFSTLALFVARIAANDVHHPTAADDLAVFTHSLNAGTNFHRYEALFPHAERTEALKYKRNSPLRTRGPRQEFLVFSPLVRFLA